MSRHRSPMGRRAYHGPPLSALVAAAGAGGAHRSVTVSPVVPTPTRAVAALLVGGALAAAGQQALATSLPAIADGTAAMRVGLESAIGLTPTSSAGTSVATVATAPAVADAAALVRAANLREAAAAAAAGGAPATSIGDTAVAPGSVRAPGVGAIAPAVGLPAAAVGLPAPAVQLRAPNAVAVVPAVAPAPAIAPARPAVAPARPAAAPARPAAAPAPAVAVPAARAQVIAGPVTSGFGGRWGTVHQGIDIAAPIGTPIHAPLAGTVISSGPASGFGMWVRLQHPDGTITVYGHINRSLVRVGQQVAAGQVIAETGNRGQSTGPHLHIGVMVGGVYVNPRPWLDAHGVRY